MTYQYKKLPVTMKMWMQFNVMPRTLLLLLQLMMMTMTLF